MGKIRAFLTGSFMSLFLPSAFAEVSINEVMPCNISTYMERDLYNFSGYIEFFNSGTSNVDLKGYRIDHEKLTGKGVYTLKWSWTVDKSIVVPAGGYKLIYFDEETTTAGHAPYKVDSDGGNLFLYDGSGKKVSSLTYAPMLPHTSYGPGGYMEPSPMKANTETFLNLTSKRVAQPTFGGATPGLQNGNVNLTLSSTTPNAKIYYTTDGSEPNKNSTLYEKAIEVSENTVIRAKAYAEGFLSSSILTGSFIFSDKKHENCNGFTVPIVSIVMDDNWLSSDSFGLAVKGTNGAPITSSCLGTGKANFMRDWKRPVNFEYIVNGRQVVSHEAEVSVAGGCSRGYDVKSFKVKAGKKLGSGNEILDYKFFPEKSKNVYKSVHVRNGGNANDPYNVRCRDGYMISLAKAMDIDYQAYEPVAYYINGEYKGMMGLRERTNADFVEANYGIDEDDIDLLKLTNDKQVDPKSGSTETYNAMIQFCENADPKSANYYEQMSKYIDMNEYIDYLILEQFVVNTDWPGNNNILWREKDNGRFRWILFDTDFGLGMYEAYASNYCDVTMNSIEWCMGEGDKLNWANASGSGRGYVADENSKWKVTLFKHLMNNEVFKQKFLNRNLMHLGSTFTNERVTSVWDSLKAVVKDEYCAAFTSDYAGNIDDLSKAKSMIEFAKKRPQYMYDYLKSYYNYSSTVNLSVSANISGVHFMMNDELLNQSSFNGKYFAGKELKLEAIAPMGYKFSHWNVGDGTVSSTLFNENSQWKYYYQGDGFEDTSWTTASFDDSAWSTGKGKMGYATTTTSYNTLLDFGDNSTAKPITAYFRNTFNISDVNGLEYLKLELMYDDGYVIYINGTEVARDNIEGTVIGTTLATDYKNDEEVTLNLKLSDLTGILRKGTNTIAIEIHQNTPSSSDLTMKINGMAAFKGGTTTEGFTEPILITTIEEAKDIVANFVKESDACPILPLLISEISPSNNTETDIVDEYGKHPDWFEIYNNGKDTINLAGLYLTDNPEKPKKSQIPYGFQETKLAPGKQIVFWADNKPYRGVQHVDFKLSNSDPESFLYLFAGCDVNNYIDMISYTPLDKNASMGRVDDNTNDWVVYNSTCETNDGSVYYKPTPGSANGSLEGVCVAQTNQDDVADIKNGMLKVYPNPAEEILEISLDDETSSFSLAIYDNIGRMVVHADANEGRASLGVGHLPTGVYTLQIVSNNVTYRKLFIKK